MFTYNILIYQFEPEPLILRGFPALLIHLSVENGIYGFLLLILRFILYYQKRTWYNSRDDYEKGRIIIYVQF